MKMKWIVALFMVSFEANAQMIIREADSLLKHYSAKADELLVADSALNNYFTINFYGVSMYASVKDKQKDIPEFKVTWSELPVYKAMMQNETRESSMSIMLEKGGKPFSKAVQKQYSEGCHTEIISFHPPMKPLTGYRIAIDPGHIADDTVIGRLEEKFVSLNVPSGKDSVHVAFAEGQLTWQTAVLLAARLRDQGAEVIFTRSGPNMTAFGKTFEQWKKDDYIRTLDSLLKVDPKNQNLIDVKNGKYKGDRGIFRFVFRDADLRKRAEVINAFKPHLTIAIHYNVDETNSPWNKPSSKNFCMLFVPGAFQSGELSDSEKRFDFLRLLLLDDVEQSIKVSNLVGIQFAARLNVKLANATDATYLAASCRKTGRKGIYSRNLSMTRLVHGPIVFGETLYQDNGVEALALSQMNITDRISGQLTSKRVMQVADAYFQGVTEWFNSNK